MPSSITGSPANCTCGTVSKLNLAEEKIESEKDLLDSPGFAKQRQEILDEIKSDPKAALLMLSARIEEQVRGSLEKRGLLPSGRFVSLRQAVGIGVEHGVFPEEFLPAFQDCPAEADVARCILLLLMSLSVISSGFDLNFGVAFEPFPIRH